MASIWNCEYIVFVLGNALNKMLKLCNCYNTYVDRGWSLGCVVFAFGKYSTRFVNFVTENTRTWIAAGVRQMWRGAEGLTIPAKAQLAQSV